MEAGTHHHTQPYARSEQGKGFVKSPLSTCRESLLHPQGVPCACNRDHPLLSGYPAPGMSLAACDNKAENTTE